MIEYFGTLKERPAKKGTVTGLLRGVSQGACALCPGSGKNACAFGSEVKLDPDWYMIRRFFAPACVAVNLAIDQHIRSTW